MHSFLTASSLVWILVRLDTRRLTRSVSVSSLLRISRSRAISSAVLLRYRFFAAASSRTVLSLAMSCLHSIKASVRPSMYCRASFMSGDLESRRSCGSSSSRTRFSSSLAVGEAGGLGFGLAAGLEETEEREAIEVRVFVRIRGGPSCFWGGARVLLGG